MTITNYRTTVERFTPPSSSKEPQIAELTTKKKVGTYVQLSNVRGESISHIEKMTHPLTEPSGTDYFSPYMISLLGESTLLAFAEKALQAPRKRLLDSLGIDDSQQNQRQHKLRSDYTAISRFYSTPPAPITLNGSPFVEQEPTTPYFSHQKIITPDFGIYRNSPGSHKPNLFNCGFRDDSEIFYDDAPIKQLQKHNYDIHSRETDLRADGKALNKAHYFIEMMEYLTNRGHPKDFVVQNSLESSSDKNTPHFQYIPNDTPLPVFAHTPGRTDNLEACLLDWHLPSVWKRIDLQQPDWQESAKYLQYKCQELLDQHHISTTPVFRKMEDSKMDIYLIFKKNCSDIWNMTQEDIQLVPGWLESCGIFIANSPKAEAFNNKGAQDYYATYRVTAEHIEIINGIFEI
ncbi:hypothetical protein AEQ67_22395 [Pseudomonas sp. RIT-PI-q]|uniref:hypothetical protein n=1 Tax=Pseudomonas sp. RIT-PI-q TaxID=1690247 RepID=UPI0006CC2B7A|nr:hypothetical protein [Pseudomonas sp. RIT-PI-q]KPG94896.1 hypothetical protein AEQ67_22395 [Pseudomonas sp. RIT-PI-q]